MGFSLRVAGVANIGGVARLHGRLEHGKVLGGEKAILALGGNSLEVVISSIGIVAGGDGMITVSLDRAAEGDWVGGTLNTGI